MVTLPKSGAPTDRYEDPANGFAISAPIGSVTFGAFGVGVWANASMSAMEANDEVVFSFYDQMLAPRTASNVSILLSETGRAGTVQLTLDGVPGPTVPAIPGQTIDVTGPVHALSVALPDGDPGSIYLEAVAFDHDCF
jgi:hypothetical protein